MIELGDCQITIAYVLRAFREHMRMHNRFAAHSDMLHADKRSRKLWKATTSPERRSFPLVSHVLSNNARMRLSLDLRLRKLYSLNYLPELQSSAMTMTREDGLMTVDRSTMSRMARKNKVKNLKMNFKELSRYMPP